MANTTYSFEDVQVVLAHPAIGQNVANGTGIGTITIAMTTDLSTHDVAADGSVMVSKVLGLNGTVALAIQQTSSLDAWLRRWYNYVETADASEWAQMTISMRNTLGGESITMSGVSPQKLPDRPYQSQGQLITWTLMAQRVTQQ